LKGKSGSIEEKFDGKESQITFLPYDLFQNKRILLLIQDCNSGVNNSNKCIENNNNKELHLFNENVLTRLGSFFNITTFYSYLSFLLFNIKLFSKDISQLNIMIISDKSIFYYNILLYFRYTH